MDFTAAGHLPRHLYCFADRAFTRKGGAGFEPCVWFGLTSTPGRVWGCTVLLECGAVYRNLPPHAIAFSPDAESIWHPQQAQLWDCYGWRFTALEYPYLAGLDVLARVGGESLPGRYLFTAVPFADGFSKEPEQAKEFTFVALDNGRLTIQPTDKTLFRDASFTTGTGWPTDIRRQTEAWSCE